MRGAHGPPTVLTDLAGWPDVAEFVNRLMAVDALCYPPGDLLAKVDRTAMAVSLETRASFVDHRVVEFVWRSPLSAKGTGRGKRVLWRILYEYLPKGLVERPKAGFGIPLCSWLWEPLDDWAEALLDEQRLHREGFFDPRSIRQKWDEHPGGSHQQSRRLWNVPMSQAWLAQNG